MKRLRRTVLHLLVILLVLALSVPWSSLYRTPQEVMAANERGLHYGPSQQILLEYDGPDHTRLLIGKIDDRTLSVIPTQRAWLLFWRLKSGGVTGQLSMFSDLHTVTGYEREFELFYGITDCPGAASIRIALQGYDKTGEPLEPQILELPVDENGFFYLENAVSPEEDSRYEYANSAYATVYDGDGNILYSLEP